MKKVIFIYLQLVLLFSHLQVQAEYWKENSWYTSCYETLFGPPVEKIIPDIIMQHDQITLHNPDHLSKEREICTRFLYDNKEFCIETISNPLTSGTIYQTFQMIVGSIPSFTKYNIQLRLINDDYIQGPMTLGSYILLHTKYHDLPDATKLFILYHELQHHIYNDIANNHLIKIITLAQNPELQKKLAQHQLSLQNHIRRYVEYRADKQATLMMQCPYCLQEVANIIEQAPTQYHPQGYLQAWQYEPRINQLLTEKKCCQHHDNTGKQINNSINDQSSLLSRLVILQS